MKPLHPFSALRGVTLTEVMIVIAIIGILAGIAVPSYTDMINRNKVKQAAESLADDLKFARTEAIKRNCNVTLSFTSGASAYQITPEAGTGSCLAGVTQATIKTIDISSTGQFPGVTFASTKKATFDFRRGIADVADIAIVSKSNFSATVSVNLAGMIKICSSTIPGYSC